MVGYCTDDRKDVSSRLTLHKIHFWFNYKYNYINETKRFFVPLVFSLTFYQFYNSILGIYISNLGVRPVLVRFWDYIFRIWITVWRWEVHLLLLCQSSVSARARQQATSQHAETWTAKTQEGSHSGGKVNSNNSSSPCSASAKQAADAALAAPPTAVTVSARALAKQAAVATLAAASATLSAVALQAAATTALPTTAKQKHL